MRRRTKRMDARKRAEAEYVRRQREYHRAIMDPTSGVQWPLYGEL